MNDFFAQNVFFGMALTMIAYMLAYRLKQKVDFVLFNPLLIATLIIIAFLLIFLPHNNRCNRHSNLNRHPPYNRYILAPSLETRRIFP